MIAKRRDWEEACRDIHFERAVSDPQEIAHNGKAIRAEIVKPLRGDGWWVYAKTGIRIRKATASEVDSAKGWKGF